MSYNAEHLCHIMKVLESNCGSEKLLGSITYPFLHHPGTQSPATKPKTAQTRRCFCPGLLLMTKKQEQSSVLRGGWGKPCLSQLSLEMSTNTGRRLACLEDPGDPTNNRGFPSLTQVNCSCTRVCNVDFSK